MKRIGRILTVCAVLLVCGVFTSPIQAKASEALKVTCPDISSDEPYVFVDYTRPYLLQVDDDLASAEETYTWELIYGSKSGFSFVNQGNAHQQYFEVSEPGTYTVSVTDSAGYTAKFTVEAIEASSIEMHMNLLEDRYQIKGGDYVMAAGETTRISLMYKVEDGTGNGRYLDGTGDEKITSDDSSVIQVKTGNENILYAEGTGTAEIKLTFGENTYTQKVTVVSAEELEKLIAEDGFILSEGVNRYFTNLSMKIGQQAYLYAHWDGMEFNNGMTLDFYGDFTVTSNDENVISVDSEGYLHAIDDGTANITVKGRYTKYTFPVRVLSEAQAAMEEAWLRDVENGNVFSSGKDNYVIYCESPVYGNTGKFGTVSSADDYISGYESADPDILQVSEEGEFTALKKGRTTLKVHLTDGNVNEYTILVKQQIPPVFKLMGMEAGIRLGETKQINATYDRDVFEGLDEFTDMYTTGRISVESDKPDILSVEMLDDYYGAANLSAKSEGTAVLTVTEVNTGTKQQFTVVIAKGESEEETTDNGTLTLDKASGLPKISTSTYDEIAKAVFTEEEMKESTKRDVEIVVNQAYPGDDEKSQIESELKEGESAGMYLDITVVKTVWYGEYGYSADKVTELSAPIRFTLAIPDKLQGMENYFVLRNHEGNIERLTDLDEDPKTVTFETDAFSTYLLAYETDTKVDDPADDPQKPADDPQNPADDPQNPADGSQNLTDDSENSADNDPQQTKGASDKAETPQSGVVETGIYDAPFVWIALMAAAISVSAVIVFRRKEQ